METKEKPQAFVAKYNFEVPEETYGETKDAYYRIKNPSATEYGWNKYQTISEWAANLLREYGVPIEVEISARKQTRTARWFNDGIAKVQAGINVEGNSKMESGYSTASIRTNAALGPTVHKQSRAKLEKFLRDNGIKFELDCVMEFSSNVCQPVPEEMLTESLSESEPDSLKEIFG